MSKPVKNLVTQAYRKRFEKLDGAVLVDIRGIKSNENNVLRGDLAQKKVTVTVVKNSLAKLAWSGTALEQLGQLLDGPCAVVYGGETVVDVARALIEQVKKLEKLTFRGALMEGQLFGPDQVEALSKYPTRAEAQSQVIQLILSPAGNVISAATSAGANLAGILAALVEKLEKAEPPQTETPKAA
jgi:large subunit ribosomal protein L10